LLFAVPQTFAARPLTVEDVGVVEKGMELEISSDTDPLDNIYNEVGIVANFAAGPNLQIGVEKPFIHQAYHPWGNGDTSITAKYLFNDNWGIKVAVETMHGDEVNDFGNDFIEYAFVLIYGFESGKLGIDTNLGWSSYDHHEWWSEDVKNNWNLGLALKYPVLNDLTIVGEATKMIVQGDYLDNKTENHVLFRGGFVYEGWGFPVDFAVYSLPETGHHGGFTAGVTLPIEY
ncbi:hypothetical protein KJ742_01840, partial [Patescibacteria group bacterium]|nr:hypothetical protein [Patescibacteria group bacterium]